MVSEADIAEARRKALRNGEEDPVAVAQRYLNVYRQMHIFSEEKKEEFNKSLLSLSPIIISVISSLPGGLTFQDYIDEILSMAGREKSARDNSEEDSFSTPAQPQILSTAQASIQPQQVITPVMSGEAKLSMGKEFADEFAKIMTGIVAKQTMVQKESLAKVAQDLGKTQLFIAKKLEDNKTERQAEITNLCKIIAQSHTALSTSLAVLGKNIAAQKQENAVVSIPTVERSIEDDIRLAEMIAQSQERMMSGLLARLPQAVGVGNVNVNAASRSVEDDIRLAEMIAQSQEKVLSKLLDNLPQVLSATTAVSAPPPPENETNKSAEHIEEMMSLMTKSQERLIETLVEKLPQMNANMTPIPEVVSPRSVEDDERLVEIITKSQEKLISSLIDRIPLSEPKEVTSRKTSKRTMDDDERLIRLITTSQENMLKSLIEKNVFVAQAYPQTPIPSYNEYQPESTVNSFSNYQTENTYPDYNSAQNAENYSNDEIDFSMFTPIEEVNSASSDLYDDNLQNIAVETEEQQSVDSYNDLSTDVVESEVVEVKKKKKKKKKKKNNNKEVEEKAESQSLDDGLSFLDGIVDENTVIDFDNIGNTQENSLTDDEISIDTVDQNEEAIKKEALKDNVDITDEILSDEDDSDNKFDDKWLDFEEDDEDIKTDIKIEKRNDEDNLNKTEWGFDSEDDSWGIGIAQDSNTEETEEGWEYVEDDGGEYSQEEGWEYVEDDGSEYSQEEGWEYIEDDGNEYSQEDWEYVEAIDDNSKIYSSDSYSQKLAPVGNIVNKSSKINLTSVPQIHDETSEDEIEDPYKNSILKD